MKNYLVITGGSRGIGKATIERFIEAGWHAINLSRTHCALPKVRNIKIDLANPTSISQCSDELCEALRDATKICLVHNAAYLPKDSVSSISLDVLNQALQINLLAPISINQLCIPLMKPGSSILYIGSALAEMAVAGCASYAVSKHAVVGLMRATCQDLAPLGIRSACICPGLVDTPLLKETMDEKSIDWLLNHKVIAKRLIAPEEIAEFIYTCAMQVLINGKIIHVDLGQFAT